MMYLMHAVKASHQTSEMGDYLGMESCIDLMRADVGEDYWGGGIRMDGNRGRGIRRSEKKVKVKEYPLPPPIRGLVPTGNVQRPWSYSHLPWVMKRYYSGDGRLVIREEKAPDSEYLLSHRSDGRLTLQLVPMSYKFGEKEHQLIAAKTEPAVADRDVYKALVSGSGGAVKCYKK